MLRKINASSSLLTSSDSSESKTSKPLDPFVGKYRVVSIDEPMHVLDQNALKLREKVADYGVLAALAGTWYSYNENSDRQSSGIHTTLMPSPGTDQNKIPGKFVFDCEEYLEKIHFELVPGGIRNRGGATEQFCGAVKYEQSIKSVSKPKDEAGLYPGIHEENGMYLWMSDVLNHQASNTSIETDRGVHRWDNDEGLETLIQNLYPSRPDHIEIEKFATLVKNNPYLDVPFFNVGTINKPQYVIEQDINNRPIASIVPAKELKEKEGAKGPYFIPDYSISRSGVIPHGSTMTLLGNLGSQAGSIVLNGKPKFVRTSDLTPKIKKAIEDSVKLTPEQLIELVEAASNQAFDKVEAILANSISSSNPVPSYLLKTLIKTIQKIVKDDKLDALWDYDHLAISPSMGGGKNGSNNHLDDSSDLKRPFDLDHPPLPFTAVEKLDATNDKGENLVYTQRMFLHPLYPYSVRPDLRLRDAIKDHKVDRYIKFTLSSKNKTGLQGGILNIPFVNRFVPTVEMKMNMWIEEVTENGQTFLQLQYEQIVFFEFGFGDNGGLTSWPHIQVNTLRKYENLNDWSKALVDEQFACSTNQTVSASDKQELVKEKEGAVADKNQTGCPFHSH